MKHFNLVQALLLLAFILGLSTSMSYAQTKSQKKEAAKVAKSEAKKLTKAGWELVGIGSLESAIEDAYLKTMTGYTEYSAAVSGFSTQSAAIRQARNQVREAYAQETATELQSIIGDQTLGIPAAVVEQLKSSVTSHSKASIYGQLKEAYTISRKVGNEYEVRSFYLLSDDDKFNAQLTALRQSIAITKLNQEISAAMEEAFKDSFDENGGGQGSDDAADE